MALAAGQYRDLLLALAPPGRALPTDLDSTWAALVLALADELARVDARVDDLVDEADPRTALETLPDWERVCGLPGPCSREGETLQERREGAHLVLTAQGGQSPAYYEEVAAALGVAAGVEEFRPFRAGAATAGDPLTNDPWLYHWRVRGPEVTVTEFGAGCSCAGDPLRSWGNEALECHVSRLAPAHTVVLFAYGDEED